uniref:Uncharacterized protein n=1 Tax=Chromera velia CCMP2878 TaxID=1169474 RepID=A0A0G4HT05_9ALVE|eukprot:Cvel_8354.t1-p1 / transcript=Cvel_8354.t1 / gene=Cvel_8354 / organism=Chromera_velia_CCMP2878 / gene_product=hypothetical protein / transcript_product=hypothetical protein / location=Cvel_scaffold460:19582-20985(+) / protein_length=278 / sequence_SO=supercontig / SO=protein_coding / is_pseudo=false
MSAPVASLEVSPTFDTVHTPQSLLVLPIGEPIAQDPYGVIHPDPQTVNQHIRALRLLPNQTVNVFGEGSGDIQGGHQQTETFRDFVLEEPSRAAAVRCLAQILEQVQNNPKGFDFFAETGDLEDIANAASVYGDPSRIHPFSFRALFFERLPGKPCVVLINDKRTMELDRDALTDPRHPLLAGYVWLKYVTETVDPLWRLFVPSHIQFRPEGDETEDDRVIHIVGVSWVKAVDASGGLSRAQALRMPEKRIIASDIHRSLPGREVGRPSDSVEPSSAF